MTELWRAAYGSYQAMLDRGVDIVARRGAAAVPQPARFDDELSSRSRSRTWASPASSPATRPACGELVAEGELRHVLVDRRTVAKTPLPDWLGDGLEPWTVSSRRSECRRAGALA